LFQQQERRYVLADKLSKVPAALESRSQFKEPNKMFENKVAVAKVGQTFYTKIYEKFKQDKAQAYILQAKITYAGSPREFGGIDGKESFIINQAAQNPETGETEIQDDIASLPEMKVSTVPAKDGINLRMQLRDDYSSILQAVQADPNNRLLTLSILKAILSTTPLEDDDKEEFDKAIHLLQMQAGLQVLASIKQIQQSMNPQPQPGQAMGALQGQGGQQQVLPQPQKGQEQEVPQQASQREMTDKEMKKGTPQEVMQKQ
jgi:hypothetical protein